MAQESVRWSAFDGGPLCAPENHPRLPGHGQQDIGPSGPSCLNGEGCDPMGLEPEAPRPGDRKVRTGFPEQGQMEDSGRAQEPTM